VKVKTGGTQQKGETRLMFQIFEETRIGNMAMKNRIVRSATWENRATEVGTML
jgi:2,4-dienoyl-CoA reductase-like NADH-dependent reductase (Old Yellow Enzyme family)